MRLHGLHGPARLLSNIPRREYWSGLLFLSPGDLPDPGIEPESPVCPALAGGYLPLNHQGGPYIQISYINFSHSILCLLFCPQFSELGKNFNLQFVIYIYSIGFLRWCSGKPKKKFYLKNTCS